LPTTTPAAQFARTAASGRLAPAARARAIVAMTLSPAPVTSNTYYDWMLHNAYFIYAAQAAMAKFVDTFKEFPVMQHPNTFTVDDALRKMSETVSGAG